MNVAMCEMKTKTIYNKIIATDFNLIYLYTTTIKNCWNSDGNKERKLTVN